MLKDEMKIDIYKNQKKLFSVKPEKVEVDMDEYVSSVHVVFPKEVKIKKDDKLRFEIIVEEIK